MIRLLLAVALSGGISLVGTKALIEWLERHRIGQPIRDDGPDGHQTKAGTPTMGGAAIVGGAVVAYVLSDSVQRRLHANGNFRDVGHRGRGRCRPGR